MVEECSIAFIAMQSGHANTNIKVPGGSQLELSGICEDILLYLRRFRDAKVHYPARRERAKSLQREVA